MRKAAFIFSLSLLSFYFCTSCSEKDGGEKKHSEDANTDPALVLGAPVDMSLTMFFLFTLMWSEPKVLEVSIPAENKENLPPESASLTLLLTGNDEIFYCWGDCSVADSVPLKKISFGEGELRKLLIDQHEKGKNSPVIIKMSENSSYKKTDRYNG